MAEDANYVDRGVALTFLEHEKRNVMKTFLTTDYKAAPGLTARKDADARLSIGVRQAESEEVEQ